jgi:hypothetical protein
MAAEAEIQPWEKQPGETGRAYEAFRTYLNLGPERTIRGVAEKREACGQNSVSVRWLETWASRHGWRNRAEQWDAELYRQEYDEHIRAARDMGRRHAKIAARGIEKAVRRLVDMDPNELTPSQVLSYISEFTRIERISRGDPENLEALRAREAATDFDIRADIEEYAPVYQSLLDRGLLQIEGQSGYADDIQDEDPEEHHEI